MTKQELIDLIEALLDEHRNEMTLEIGKSHDRGRMPSFYLTLRDASEIATVDGYGVTLEKALDSFMTNCQEWLAEQAS